jgi:hypothetical protein
MVAVAVRDTAADQVLHDVFFDERHAERGAYVGKQAGETVVQIGVDEHLHVLCRD